MQCVLTWLQDHASLIQALTAVANLILSGALVCATVGYLRESRKMRVLSERQTTTAEAQAAMARENLALLKEQYEARLGEGPRIVRVAIALAKGAIVVWIGQAMSGVLHPEKIPDPSTMIPPELNAALGPAYRISPACGKAIVNAITDMRFAETALANQKQTPPPRHNPVLGAPSPPRANIPLPAVDALTRAKAHLESAELALPAE